MPLSEINFLIKSQTKGENESADLAASFDIFTATFGEFEGVCITLCENFPLCGNSI